MSDKEKLTDYLSSILTLQQFAEFNRLLENALNEQDKESTEAALINLCK